MEITALSRGRFILAVVFLSASGGTACAPAYHYPEPGEPGPVITAAGDTIPEGPNRDVFMAGFDRGFLRGQAVSAPDLGEAAAAIGGVLVGGTVPLLVVGSGALTPLGYYTAGGLGLIGMAALAGPTVPLTELPAAVAARGPYYQGGYLVGYDRGHRSKLWESRRRAAVGGGAIGLTVFLILLYASTGG